MSEDTKELRRLVRSDEGRWATHIAECDQCAGVVDTWHSPSTGLCHHGGLIHADLTNSRSGLRASIYMDRMADPG